MVDSKTLITGASSTSGGAYVVNDRYAPTIDLIGERVVPLLSAMPVTDTDFTDLPFTGGMFSAQEILQVRSLTGDEVHVTVSYVNRTEEVYDVVV